MRQMKLPNSFKIRSTIAMDSEVGEWIGMGFVAVTAFLDQEIPAVIRIEHFDANRASQLFRPGIWSSFVRLFCLSGVPCTVAMTDIPIYSSTAIGIFGSSHKCMTFAECPIVES